ncbi:MAG: diguanylate cyclase [Myxococcales bacterium]|nr:diguanylate cyclase [Myxococcales bacterium]
MKSTAAADSDRTQTRVLLVDDEEDYRLVVRGLLTKAAGDDFDVEWVATGGEGLTRLASGHHDVCLLDYNLRGMTGLDVLSKASERVCAAPIILLTGQGDLGVDRGAMDAGAAAYLDKGELTAPLLERTIRYAIAQRRVTEVLRTREERLALAAQAREEGIWDWNLDTLEIYYSPGFHAVLGLEDASLRPDLEEWFSRVHPDDLDRLMANINAHMEGRAPRLDCEHRVRFKDGRYRWILARGTVARDRRRGTSRMVGSIEDVTERRAADEDIRRQAMHDELTGLLNRRQVEERLATALTEAKRYGDPLSIALCDLDGLKVLNDTRGHGAGDQALRDVGGIIRSLLREADFAGRCGGDEFCIVLPHTVSESAATCLERIRLAVEALGVDRGAGSPLNTTVSIGVAERSESTSVVARLFEAADKALYEAKRQGGNRVVVGE